MLSSNSTSPIPGDEPPPDGAASSRFLAALGFTAPVAEAATTDSSGATAPTPAFTATESGPPLVEPSSTPLPQSAPPKTAYPAALPPKRDSGPSTTPYGENGALTPPAKEVPPFWFNDLGASVNGTSAASTEPGNLPFETKPVSPPRQAPRPQQPRLEVLQLACPACRSALSISRAHINIEGACPTCGVMIVARQNPNVEGGIQIESMAPIRPEPPPAPAIEQELAQAAPPIPERPVDEPVPALLGGFDPVDLTPQPTPPSVVAAAQAPIHTPLPVQAPSLANVAAEAAFAARLPLSQEPDPDPVSSFDEPPSTEPDSPSLHRDPVRLFAGVMLVLVTCVLLVLAVYAPQYSNPIEETPAVPTAAAAGDEPGVSAAKPEVAAAIATTIRAQPIAEPLPPEAVPDPTFFQSPETQLPIVESTPIDEPAGATPAIVIPSGQTQQRPLNEAERITLATETVENFLTAASVEDKSRWILEPAAYQASLEQFYTYEPLTSAVPPTIKYHGTEFVVAEERWVSTFDIEMQATLPHRICVVHQPDRTAGVDFALYRQIREGSLHRYLTRSASETSPVAPKTFRVALRRIAYRDVRGRIDATLFHDPPILFEIGLPFHDGTPVAIPVSLETPIVPELESVGWDAPSYAVVELQWQPSETNPKQPIPTISRLVNWKLWPES